MRTTLSTLAAALAALALAPEARAAKNVLDLQEIIQEEDQWCWAASSRATLLHFGVDQQQCDVTEYTRLNSDSVDVNLGTKPCCSTPTPTACNKPAWLWNFKGSIEDILKHFASLKTAQFNSALLLTDISATVDAGGLFVITWKWISDGSAHFLIGHGYDGSSVYYLDPWPGEGKKIGDFSWMQKNAEHQWTLSLTAEPAYACQGAKDGASCDDGDPCTESDKCTSQKCAGTAKVCSGSAELCHAAPTCDSKTGDCAGAPLADGTTCPGGACKAGVCAPKSSGCSAAGAGPAALSLALVAVVLLRRRRR